MSCLVFSHTDVDYYIEIILIKSQTRQPDKHGYGLSDFPQNSTGEASLIPVGNNGVVQHPVRMDTLKNRHLLNSGDSKRYYHTSYFWWIHSITAVQDIQKAWFDNTNVALF